MLGRLFGGFVGAAYGSIESVSADVVGSGTKETGVAAEGARHGGTASHGHSGSDKCNGAAKPRAKQDIRTRCMLSA